MQQGGKKAGMEGQREMEGKGAWGGNLVPLREERKKIKQNWVAINLVGQ